MVLPDRIAGLIQKLEAGDKVTQKDVNKVATLQVLDLAKLGEDFVREHCAREDARTEELRKQMESLNV